MAFIDQFQDNFTALDWPNGLELNPNREFVFKITGLGDLTGATFECQVRRDSTSSTALIEATVTTSTNDGGTVLINIDDAATANLFNLGRRMYLTLDAIVATDRYAFYAGYIPCNPYGTGLPVEVTEVVFEDLLAQLEAQVALAETAATAAETAQAAAEAAAASATGIGDGDKGDITVSSGGSVWTVDEAGVTQHQAALSLTKSQISDLNEADYATAAQGALADSALQSGANISVLTNDSGFITGYTVTEGDVTGALSGATIADVVTPASDDKVLIQDTSDTNSLKYVSFDQFGGGGVDWTATQTSAVANGASNTAFKFLADNDFNLGKLFSFGDNSGDEKVHFKNGLLHITETGYSPAYLGVLNAHQVGVHLSYNSANMVWNGSLVTTDDDFVSLSYRGLKFPTGYDASIGYNPVADADQATSTLTITGQNAFPSATVNQDGGDLILKSGDSASGGGSDGLILVQNLPTSDPGVTGALWNDAGTLKISL